MSAEHTTQVEELRRKLDEANQEISRLREKVYKAHLESKEHENLKEEHSTTSKALVFWFAVVVLMFFFGKGCTN